MYPGCTLTLESDTLYRRRLTELHDDLYTEGDPNLPPTPTEPAPPIAHDPNLCGPYWGTEAWEGCVAGQVPQPTSDPNASPLPSGPDPNLPVVTQPDPNLPVVVVTDPNAGPRAVETTAVVAEPSLPATLPETGAETTVLGGLGLGLVMLGAGMIAFVRRLRRS